MWSELGRSGDITIVRTRDAANLIKEEFRGAEVLVTGSTFVTGNVLVLLGYKYYWHIW